jgi:hypothetical protein
MVGFLACSSSSPVTAELWPSGFESNLFESTERIPYPASRPSSISMAAATSAAVIAEKQRAWIGQKGVVPKRVQGEQESRRLKTMSAPLSVPTWPRSRDRRATRSGLPGQQRGAGYRSHPREAEPNGQCQMSEPSHLIYITQMNE